MRNVHFLVTAIVVIVFTISCKKEKESSPTTGKQTIDTIPPSLDGIRVFEGWMKYADTHKLGQHTMYLDSIWIDSIRVRYSIISNTAMGVYFFADSLQWLNDTTHTTSNPTADSFHMVTTLATYSQTKTISIFYNPGNDFVFDYLHAKNKIYGTKGITFLLRQKK